MPGGIEIQLRADPSAAIQGLQRFSSNVETTAVRVRAAGSRIAQAGEGFANSLNRSLAPADALNKGVNQITDSVNRNTKSLSEMGSTMLNSFTKGFSLIRTIANILPGLGVSTIFLFGFRALASVFSSANDKAKELLKTIRSVSEIKISGEANVAGDIAKVQALAAIVKDQTRAYRERNNALEQLKGINKDYFGDLNTEASSIDDVTKRVEEYTKAIIAQATVKEFSNEIGKINKLISEQKKVVDEANKAYEQQAQRSAKAQERLNKVIENTQFSTERGTLFALEQARIQRRLTEERIKDVDKEKDVLTSLQNKYDELFADLNKAVEESVKLTPLKKVSDGIKDESDKIISTARLFVKQFGDVFVVPDLEESFTNTREKILAAAKKLLSDIDAGKLIIKVKPSVEVESFIPTISGPTDAQIERFRALVHESIKKEYGLDKPFSFDLSIDVAVQAEKIRQKFKQFGDKIFLSLDPKLKIGELEKLFDKINSQFETAKGVAEATANAFSNIFDEMLRGKNIFQVIGNAVKQLISDLVQATIRAAIFRVVMSAFGFGGAGNIPAGFLTSLPRGAKGGIVPPGFPGDSYPALLSSNEVVLNPSQLARIVGQGGGVVVMDVNISGDTMRLVQRRSDKKAKRTFG